MKKTLFIGIILFVTNLFCQIQEDSLQIVTETDFAKIAITEDGVKLITDQDSVLQSDFRVGGEICNTGCVSDCSYDLRSTRQFNVFKNQIEDIDFSSEVDLSDTSIFNEANTMFPFNAESFYEIESPQVAFILKAVDSNYALVHIKMNLKPIPDPTPVCYEHQIESMDVKVLKQHDGSLIFDGPVSIITKGQKFIFIETDRRFNVQGRSFSKESDGRKTKGVYYKK